MPKLFLRHFYSKSIWKRVFIITFTIVLGVNALYNHLRQRPEEIAYGMELALVLATTLGAFSYIVPRHREWYIGRQQKAK